MAGHSPDARARQAEKQRRHAAALKAWHPSDKPDWLNEETYRVKIQPRLSGVTVPVHHQSWASPSHTRQKSVPVDICHIPGTG